MDRSAFLAGVLFVAGACVDTSNLGGGGQPGVDAGPDDAGGPDASSDAGATCARDCGPLSCDASDNCTVERIASQLSSPSSLVVDDAYAYWVEQGASGAVRKASVTTNAPPIAVATSQANPFAVALFAGSAVWTTTDDGGMNASAVDGGASRFATAAGPTWLAASGGTLYVAHRSAPGSGAGAIAGCQIGGCAVMNLLYDFEPSVVDQLRAVPGGLAWVLDATKLRTCSIGTCTASGGVRTAFTEPDGIAAFTADADFYYVARRGGAGGIDARPYAASDAGAPTPIVATAEGLSSLVVDGGSLFYTSSTMGIVARVARTGGTPVVLATGGQPTSVAVRGPYVYWIDTSDGSIRRTAR